MNSDSFCVATLQGHHDGTSPGGERRQRVIDHYRAFPFSSDEAFQQGLSGILAHHSMNQMPDSDKSKLVLKTKVFYFNRVTGHDLTLEDVQGDFTADMDRFHAQNGNEYNQTAEGAEHEETRTLTFAELKSLIERGNTDNIPNNKTIANVLNDGVPSESSAPLRKKPWELASQP